MSLEMGRLAVIGSYAFPLVFPLVHARTSGSVNLLFAHFILVKSSELTIINSNLPCAMSGSLRTNLHDRLRSRARALGHRNARVWSIRRLRLDSLTLTRRAGDPSTGSQF